MIDIRILRSLAGRTSWIPGVVPLFRWVVNVVYAVVTAVYKCDIEGTERTPGLPRNVARSRYSGFFAVLGD